MAPQLWAGDEAEPAHAAIIGVWQSNAALTIHAQCICGISAEYGFREYYCPVEEN